MGLPARKIEYEEPPVEQRITRPESDVGHIQKDVADLKIAIQRLDDKLDVKFDGLKDSIANLAITMENRFAGFERRLFTLILWSIGLYLGLATGLLTALARGFHWI